ncbi:MAG: hypothetical protein JHC26_05575 [Thermofilum sp.]|uniref:hypothetical protein n=1 Tax=Thermofilum sp. TaxID=1961369 RepID=UPI002585F8DC|nr:hypothetical protein [Thermofilum sp.]MCI4408541.1 hypothetical protein [Thermofilum sp.]
METISIDKRVESEIRDIFQYLEQIFSKGSGREVKIDIEREFDEKGNLIAVKGTFSFDTFDWSLWGIIRDTFGGKGYGNIDWYVYPQDQNTLKVEIAVLLV